MSFLADEMISLLDFFFRIYGGAGEFSVLLVVFQQIASGGIVLKFASIITCQATSPLDFIKAG